MTNIYNKKVLVKNGTLIGNWYEEEILRERTGEGRTIPAQHIPKRHFDFENEIKSDIHRDNTFNRILGERKYYLPTNTTNNSAYCDFKKRDNDHKLNKISIKDKIFEDFYKTYLPCGKKPRKPTPFEKLNELNQTKNFNLTDRSSLEIRSDQESSFISNNLISNSLVGGYVDKFLPSNAQKEPYWSNRIEKEKLYSSEISKKY